MWLPLSDKCKFKYMSTFQRSHHSPPKDSGPRQIGPTNTNTNENANANTFQRSNHSPPKQVTDIVNETCWAVCVYKLVCVCTNVCHLVQTEIATLLNYLINMVLQSIFTIFWQIQIHNFLADVCMSELRRTNIHLQPPLASCKLEINSAKSYPDQLFPKKFGTLTPTNAMQVGWGK